MELRRSIGGLRNCTMIRFSFRLVVVCFVFYAFVSPANSVVPVQSSDVWPQFRGNYQLTGVSSAQLPAVLKLLWTYDTGEIIESSAAIVDNTVYVGTGSKELIAV